jgi:hypothetical protein
MRIWYIGGPEAKLPPNVVPARISQVVENWKTLPPELVGCAVERNTFETFGKTELEAMRNMVSVGKFVFAVGDELSQNYTGGKLGYRTRVKSQESAAPIVADGVYAQGKRGIASVQVFGARGMSRPAVLSEVVQAVRFARAGGRDDNGWEVLPDQNRSFPMQDERGRLLQRLRLRVRSGKQSDDWIVGLENRVEPGTSAYGSGYFSRRAESKVNAPSALGLPCYGPSRKVPSNQPVDVIVGCPGDTFRWSWNSGATIVEDWSKPSAQEVCWSVLFDPKGDDCRRPYTWTPGVQFRNPSGQALRVRVDNTIEWGSKMGNVPDVKTWTVSIAPQP